MPGCLAQGKTDRCDVRLRPPQLAAAVPWCARQAQCRTGPGKQGRKCHRYSSVTCPNRRSTCLSLNLPISKSVVRTNAIAPAWPNTFQSPCARSIAAAGLAHSTGSPAAIPPSTKSKGNATKTVISAIGHRFACRDNRMAKAQEFELKPWPPDVGKSGGLIHHPGTGRRRGLIRTLRRVRYTESSRFWPVSILRWPNLILRRDREEAFRAGNANGLRRTTEMAMLSFRP